MKYRTIPTEIDALQVADLLDQHPLDAHFPMWAVKALECGHLTLGQYTLEVHAPDGTRSTLRRHDWVVHTKSGYIWPCPDSEFRKSYEAVPA